MDSKSAESEAVQAIRRSTELSARIDEERLREIRELREGQKRIEMFMMRDAANGDGDGGGYTDRLDTGELESARLRAALNKLTGQVEQLVIRYDTFQRELMRREPLLDRMWDWFVERMDRGKG